MSGSCGQAILAQWCEMLMQIHFWLPWQRCWQEKQLRLWLRFVISSPSRKILLGAGSNSHLVPFCHMGRRTNPSPAHHFGEGKFWTSWNDNSTLDDFLAYQCQKASDLNGRQLLVRGGPAKQIVDNFFLLGSSFLLWLLVPPDVLLQILSSNDQPSSFGGM